MPLPWKKTKVTRISQIVADLQSPKHGGSLVVETGFPTSLVDLFVKNRDRLKKPSSKKKKKKRTSKSISNLPEPEISDPTNTLSGPPLDMNSLTVPTVHHVDFMYTDRFVGSQKVGVYGSTSSRCEECGVDLGRVIGAVLKIFGVVVLVLSTKKFAVGITLSAFLLFLLESVGKHAACFLKAYEYLIRKVSLFFMTRQNGVWIPRKMETREQESESIAGNQLIDETELISLPEPDFAGSHVNAIDDINGSEIAECLDGKKTNRELEENKTELDPLVSKNQRAKSKKLKAKIIKKLVPKKLRGQKNGKKNNKLLDQEQEDVVEVVQEEQEEEYNTAVSDLDECSSKLEAKLTTANERNKIQGNSGYMFLVLVVLAGLSGGKVLALVLTIAVCFLFISIRPQKRPEKMCK